MCVRGKNTTYITVTSQKAPHSDQTSQKAFCQATVKTHNCKFDGA